MLRNRIFVFSFLVIGGIALLAVLNYAGKEEAKIPLAGSNLLDSQKSAREIIREAPERRDTFSKTWVRNDATLASRFSQTPVHYKNPQGQYVEIDPNFTDRGTYFENTANFFSIKLPKDFTGSHILSGNGSSVTLIPQSANAVTPVTSSEAFNIMTQKYFTADNITYENAWTATDVKLRGTWFGFKEQLIVKDSTAPTTFSWKVAWTGQTPTLDGKRLKFGGITLDALVAHDAKNRNVPLQIGFRKQGASRFFEISYNPVLEVTSTTTHMVAYPVTIDPTSRFNPQSGVETTSFDAWIDLATTAGQSRADFRIDSANKTVTDSNDTASLIGNHGYSGHVPPRPGGARAWIQFDTASTITAGATINATASSSVGIQYVAAGGVASNDGSDYIGLFHATTSGANPLSVAVANGDWKRVTGLFSSGQLITKSADLAYAAGDCAGHDMSLMASGEARCLKLNATGRSQIAITGGSFATTTFGLGVGNDIDDVDILPVEGNNIWEISSAEGANPPILDIDWSAAAAAPSGETDDFIPIPMFEALKNLFIKKVYAK